MQYNTIQYNTIQYNTFKPNKQPLLPPSPKATLPKFPKPQRAYTYFYNIHTYIHIHTFYQ